MPGVVTEMRVFVGVATALLLGACAGGPMRVVSDQRATPPATMVPGLPDAVVAAEGLELTPPVRSTHPVSKAMAESGVRDYADAALYHVRRRGLSLPDCDCWVVSVRPGAPMSCLGPAAGACPPAVVAWGYVLVDADTGKTIMTAFGSKVPSAGSAAGSGS